MGEKLQSSLGSISDTALIVFGWVSFSVSFFLDDTVATFFLRAISRVLPQASWEIVNA